MNYIGMGLLQHNNNNEDSSAKMWEATILRKGHCFPNWLNLLHVDWFLLLFAFLRNDPGMKIYCQFHLLNKKLKIDKLDQHIVQENK